MNESDAIHAENDAENLDDQATLDQSGRDPDCAIRSCPDALHALVSEVPWVMDSKGRLVWVHPASEILYQCSADDLLGDASNRLRHIHAEDRKHVTDTWSRLAKEKRVELEYRIVVDGKKTERVSETIVSLSPDHPGHFGGLTRVVTDRHHLEGALRDSEAVYLSLVESLPLSVLRKDSRGRIQYANARACEQMGKPVEELIGRSDFGLFPAELAKKYMADDRKVIESGQLHHDVERHQSSDGSQVHVEVWKSPVHSATGDVVGIQVMFWDITTQKDAEHQVEFEKFLLSILLETVPESIYFKDVDSRFVRLSRSCAAKFGLSDPSQAIGKSDSDFFSREHARKALSDERQVMETGVPIQAAIECETHQDGRESFCSTTKVPLSDKKGRVIGTFGISRDVTRQMAAEKELARERDLLKTIIDNVPDFIYVKDRAGRFVTANASQLKLLGLETQDQILGKTDYDFADPEHACSYVADDQNVMRSGEALIDREDVYRHGTGVEMCILTTKVPLTNQEDEVIGVVGIGHDITERKQADVEMRAAKEIADKANRAKSDFLANMSHEIRTPMNAIIGMTDLVLDTKLDPTQRSFLSMVSESAESLLAVINDILDFSKIEAGKLDIEQRTFDVRESLGDTMKTLGLKAHSKGLELAFRVAPEVPRYVVGDVGRLRQVLINLVGNAVKFTSSGEVVVEIKKSSSGADEVVLRISVRDTGIGIPDHKLHTIFREFEQADTSTTRQFGGTGLGLAISSRIVELMGGEITVESEVGRGSEFAFEVKLKAAPEDAEETSRRGAVVVGGTSVLVVDDNETNRLILAEILGGWGIHATLVASGEEALAQLRSAAKRKQPFGLVISDVNMPHMSGYDFIEHVRNDSDISSTNIVVLTSGCRDGEHKLDETLSISERLMKPVKQSELFDSIVRVLGVNSSEDSGGLDPKGNETGVLPMKILLAEDNLINQKLAVSVLTRDGHQVTIANDGREVLRKIQEDQFDVVLMDIQMPELDGLETTEQIRRQEEATQSHLPIIAMTAHAMKGDREKCIDAGMDDYVAKPIRMTNLRERLLAVLPEKRSSEAIPAKAIVFPGDENLPPKDDSETHKSDSTLGAETQTQSTAEIADDVSDEITDQLPEQLTGKDDKVDTVTADFDGAIDWEQADLTVGGDPKLLAELMGVYVGEAQNLLERIDTACEHDDRDSLRRFSHTLKGASLSVGAIETSGAAGELEQLDPNADKDKLEERRQAVVNATNLAIAAIRSHLSTK